MEYYRFLALSDVVVFTLILFTPSEKCYIFQFFAKDFTKDFAKEWNTYPFLSDITKGVFTLSVSDASTLAMQTFSMELNDIFCITDASAIAKSSIASAKLGVNGPLHFLILLTLYQAAVANISNMGFHKLFTIQECQL